MLIGVPRHGIREKRAEERDHVQPRKVVNILRATEYRSVTKQTASKAAGKQAPRHVAEMRTNLEPTSPCAYLRGPC